MKNATLTGVAIRILRAVESCSGSLGLSTGWQVPQFALRPEPIIQIVPVDAPSLFVELVGTPGNLRGCHPGLRPPIGFWTQPRWLHCRDRESP
jgi:hypothetical protein